MWSGLIRNSGVSGKPILDLKSALMTAQPFFYVLLLLHLFTILLTGYIERSFCTFNVTLFKPNSTLPPSPCFCLVNSSSSHVCGCCVSQLSFKKTCISGTWNVLPGGVYFKVKCFMMQEDTSVCILYGFLLLDNQPRMSLSHYESESRSTPWEKPKSVCESNISSQTGDTATS